MPIYRYRCPSCSATREVMAKMSDAPPACVECGHSPMVKAVARTAFALKGGGWYAQGYSSSGGSSSTSSESSSASDDD